MKVKQTGCTDRLDGEYEMEKSKINPRFVFCFCFCLRRGVTFTEMGKTAGGISLACISSVFYILV